MSSWTYARTLVVAVLVALVVGVTASSAAPQDREIQKGNTSCTSPTNGNGSLGVALFSFDGDKLKVTVNIKHGLAKTKYTATLIDADTCTEIVTFDSQVKTNGKGKGRKSFSTDAGGSCAFVVDAYDGVQHAYSESVHYC